MPAGRRGAPRAKPAAAAREASGLDLLERFGRAEFPTTLYVEGPSEPLKAALLAALRHAWARACPESPLAHVFRAAESGVETILGVWQGASLFSPRDLVLVLEVEDLGRGEKRVAALAAGLAHPAGPSTLVLVESEADAPRKSLEPLRAACAERWVALPPQRRDLIRWGVHRLALEGIEADPGVVEAVGDGCEGDPLAFFNELDKLGVAASGGRLTRAAAAALTPPVLGADLPAYLGAVAAGQPAVAARNLSRLLATGVGEGAVLFALANLVGGALGGWSRHRELSAALGRRCGAHELTRALDAVYRAEAAWKGGRADAVAALEQATRAVAGAP